jgi:hypothetical protein
MVVVMAGAMVVEVQVSLLWEPQSGWHSAFCMTQLATVIRQVVLAAQLRS